MNSLRSEKPGDTMLQMSSENGFDIDQQMEDSPTSRVSSQAKSPIFRLPAELRIMIYELVLDNSKLFEIGDASDPSTVASVDHTQSLLSRFQQVFRESVEGVEEAPASLSSIQLHRRSLVRTCSRIWMEAKDIGISSNPLILRDRQSLINLQSMREADVRRVKHLVLHSSAFNDANVQMYIRSHKFGQLLRPQYFTIRLQPEHSMNQVRYTRNLIMMGIKSVDVIVLEIAPSQLAPVRLREYPYDEFSAKSMNTPFAGKYKLVLNEKLPGRYGNEMRIFAWSRLHEKYQIRTLMAACKIKLLEEWDWKE